MRALLQIFLFVAVLGSLMVIVRGITPIFPAAGAFLRFAFNPIGIILIVVLFFLMRLGMMRRRTSSRSLESDSGTKQKNR